MTTWIRSAPAFGGYYESATVRGHNVTVRQTLNNRWTARAGIESLRGSYASSDAAKAAAVQAASRMPAAAGYLTDDVLDARRELCQADAATLDGMPARICGARNQFATVSQVGGPVSVEFAWETVARIVAAGGSFRS